MLLESLCGQEWVSEWEDIDVGAKGSVSWHLWPPERRHRLEGAVTSTCEPTCIGCRMVGHVSTMESQVLIVCLSQGPDGGGCDELVDGLYVIHRKTQPYPWTQIQVPGHELAGSGSNVRIDPMRS